MQVAANLEPPDISRRPERFLDALASGCPVDARKAAVVVAHPDDETLGIGGQLPRMFFVSIVHVTDGAPANLVDAQAHGFATRAEYALARAHELEHALTLAGVRPPDRFTLGIVDQQAAFQMPRIARALVRLFEERETEIVFTHAYEGGHPDHDAVAFAVHAARALLLGQGRGLSIVEMPLYRAEGDGWALQRFEPEPRLPECTIQLGEAARRCKQEMIEAHRTQRQTLSQFPVEVERFRIAPTYTFDALPNGGDLIYERFDWGISGDQWLTRLREARSSLAIACA